MGVVVNQKQFDKIKDYIEIGKKEGELVYGGEINDSTGYFVHPTIFKDMDPEGRIMQEEIFGSVVGFAKAKNFDELLDIANNADYALTGAVISNKRAHLNRARYEFEVGNCSIADAQTQLSVISHSVGSRCPEQMPKQADQITF